MSAISNSNCVEVLGSPIGRTLGSFESHSEGIWSGSHFWACLSLNHSQIIFPSVCVLREQFGKCLRICRIPSSLPQRIVAVAISTSLMVTSIFRFRASSSRLNKRVPKLYDGLLSMLKTVCSVTPNWVARSPRVIPRFLRMISICSPNDFMDCKIAFDSPTVKLIPFQ